MVRIAFIVGLTGQSGTGKTTICEVLKGCGFGVIDCDKLAHEVMDSTNCLDALCTAFSRDILTDAKRLDRRKLGGIVFSEASLLERLNSTVHPFVMDALMKQIKVLSCNFEVIIVDAPTLFESGADSICNVNVFVTAREEILIDRICKRDMISREDGEKRLSSHRNIELFRPRCDIIIENNGDAGELKISAENLIKRIRLMAEGHEKM